MSYFKKVFDILKESQKSTLHNKVMKNPKAKDHKYAIIDNTGNVLSFADDYDTAYDKAKEFSKNKKVNIFNIHNDEMSDF